MPTSVTALFIISNALFKGKDSPIGSETNPNCVLLLRDTSEMLRFLPGF
jgi:hypothetical protein